MVMQTPSRVQTIRQPYSQVDFCIEEAINFQKALIKRDQNSFRNKKDDSQVNANYCD